MPVPKSLINQINSDPQWRKIYDANLKDAKVMASRIYLVHVTGRNIPFEELFRSLPAVLKPYHNSPVNCLWTHKCQNKLRLGRSLYFFAGRAGDFGGVALVFGTKCEQKRRGTATPFDTGGLASNRIRTSLPSENLLGEGSVEVDVGARRAFTARHKVKLKLWREVFATYLAAYFSPVSSYWTGKPREPGPAQMYTQVKQNGWQAWTHEIRFHEDLSLFDALTWCANEDQMLKLQRARVNGPARGVNSSLRRFFKQVPPLVADGDNRYLETIEAWVQRNT